jgi:hypothetical protein
MADAGLEVREDGMGNIFGRWHGTDPDAGGRHRGVSSSMCRARLTVAVEAPTPHQALLASGTDFG